MAKETQSARSKAGKKAYQAKVRAARADGKKTIKVGKNRIRIAPPTAAQGRASKKAGASIGRIQSENARKPSATTIAARKSGRAKKLAKKNQAARRKGVEAGLTSTPAAPAPEKKPRKNKETSMAAKKTGKKSGKRGGKRGKLTPKEAKRRAAKAKRTRAKNLAAAGGSKKPRTHKKRTQKKGHHKKGRKKGHKKSATVRAMSIPKGAKKIIAAERRGHRRGHRRGYAMENPLSTMEIVAGGLAMLFGLAVADVSDRWWATHSLVSNTSGTTTTYTDTGAMAPAAGATATTTASTGPFGMTPGYVNATATSAGLFNGAAVLAPMNMTRWISGAAVVVLPFLASGFVKSGTWRTGLQMFGFGALARIGGKALVDIFAQLLGGTTYGQQLYVNELAAAAQWQAAQGQTVTISLPNIGTTVPVAGAGAASGLAAPPARHGLGCGCAACSQGRTEQPPAPPGQPTQQLSAPTDSLAAPPPAADGALVPARPKHNPFDVFAGK